LLEEAHSVLAYVSFAYDWDWQGAEKGFKRALEINPNNAAVYLYYCDYLFAMGRNDEALADIKKALELDPLSLIINALTGRAYYYAGEEDKAIEQLQKTLEMDPNFRPAHVYLGDIFMQTGIYPRALSELKTANDVPRIGITHALMGKTPEAHQVVNELIEQSKHEYVPKSRLAQIYFVLGENDNGFAWLEKAYEERDFLLYSIKWARYYDTVRSDPRFKAVLKKMNLE